MRLLTKCVQCGEWVTKELGPTTPERLIALVESIPRIGGCQTCDYCLSLMRRNDFELFFENFETLINAGMSS